jgi:hypothetical protein
MRHPSLPRDLLLYVAAGQGHIRYRELAISTELITESDARVLAYAGQAHTILVTQRALVIIQVRMTLGGREKW